MFVLSQDRLNMDLDRDSLELMLNLLESDASHTKALEDCGLTDLQLTKTRDRVRQICADIQGQGHAKHLNLDNITVSLKNINFFFFFTIYFLKLHLIYRLDIYLWKRC